METIQRSYSAPANSNEQFFRKRHTVTVAFAVGLILFLLPFAEIRCNDVALAGNTGIGIATGQEWRVVMMGGSNELLKKAGEKDGVNSKENPFKSDPNVFALIAIGVGLAGLAFSFTNQKIRPLLGMSAGILGAVMLIAVMIQLKIVMKSALSQKDDKSGLNMDMGMLLKLDFTIWYYISLVSFAAAAFFSYKHYALQLKDEMKRLTEFEFQRQQKEG